MEIDSDKWMDFISDEGDYSIDCGVRNTDSLINPPIIYNQGMSEKIAYKTVKAGINKASDFYKPLTFQFRRKTDNGPS